MRQFRDAIEHCNLLDLGWNGSPYTFTNMRKGDLEVRARLDRALASGDWKTMFPNAKVYHGFANSSDHKRLIIMLRGHKVKGRESRQGRDSFKFEPMWMREESFS